MTMTEGSPGHFDPALLEVFRKWADQFDRIFRELTEQPTARRQRAESGGPKTRPADAGPFAYFLKWS